MPENLSITESGDPGYTVTLDGKSAVISRTHTETSRKWWRTRRREVVQVVGVYQCQMGFRMTRKLNRPDDVELTVGGCTVSLRGRWAT